MSYKKKVKDRPSFSSAGRMDAIRANLTTMAKVEEKDDEISITFDYVEGALAFKRNFESEVGQMYAGKILRWRGRDWRNRPECLIAQFDLLAFLAKVTGEEKSRRRARAEEDCRCYSCSKSQEVTWTYLQWAAMDEETRKNFRAHCRGLDPKRREGYLKYRRLYHGLPQSEEMELLRFSPENAEQ